MQHHDVAAQLTMTSQLADALDRERTLRATVAWYADSANHKPGHDNLTPVMRDGGARARAAIRSTS